MTSQTRRSAKREAIYELLHSTDSHPTAAWVYEQLKPKYPQLSLGTVYRNLSEFRSQGKARVVAVVEGQERFDANTADHVHFVCSACGAVLDLNCPEMDEAVKSCAEKCPYEVSASQLTFDGRCAKCAQANLK